MRTTYRCTMLAIAASLFYATWYFADSGLLPVVTLLTALSATGAAVEADID